MLSTDPWKRHRILTRVGIFGLVLYLLPTLAIVWLDQIDMRSAGMYLLVLGWTLFVVVMLILWHEVRCPRCGKRYYAKSVELHQMTGECLHCGLPKYADVNTPANPSRK
jgi:hypothetical protein